MACSRWRVVCSREQDVAHAVNCCECGAASHPHLKSGRHLARVGRASARAAPSRRARRQRGGRRARGASPSAEGEMGARGERVGGASGESRRGRALPLFSSTFATSAVTPRISSSLCAATAAAVQVRMPENGDGSAAMGDGGDFRSWSIRARILRDDLGRLARSEALHQKRVRLGDLGGRVHRRIHGHRVLVDCRERVRLGWVARLDARRAVGEGGRERRGWQ